jgi:hypothetical protein
MISTLGIFNMIGVFSFSVFFFFRFFFSLSFFLILVFFFFLLLPCTKSNTKSSQTERVELYCFFFVPFYISIYLLALHLHKYDQRNFL